MLRPPLDMICHSLGGEKHVLRTPPGVGWGCEQVFHDNPAHTPIPRSPRTRSSVGARLRLQTPEPDADTRTFRRSDRGDSVGGAHCVPWIALPVTPPQSPTGPDTQAVTAEAAGASLPTAVGGS